MLDKDLSRLRALIERQECVITRKQALACGVTRNALTHRLRQGGPWRPLLPGVYLTVSGTPALVQKEMAAILYGGPRTVITGVAALRHHGMPAPDSELIDILIPAERKRQSVSYVMAHRTTRMPRLVIGPPSRDYALPARAAADAARWLTELRDVRAVVAGAVQSRRCTAAELSEELRAGGVRDSALFRAVLDEVGEGVRSAPEAELRVLIGKAGLPMPLFNPRLYLLDGTFIAQPDAWWPEASVAIEVDSKRWHFQEATWERTMDRHSDLGQYSIVTLHFTPHKIRTEPAFVIKRMTNAYNSGIARPRLPIKTVPAERHPAPTAR
jgi:hypothetical protein